MKKNNLQTAKSLRFESKQKTVYQACRACHTIVKSDNRIVGQPKSLHCDNSPEYISEKLVAWEKREGSHLFKSLN